MIFNNTLYKDLNNNQLKLIKWLEVNEDKVMSMSITEVAQANYVSVSYISKTLKKVGYFGWKDFKANISGKSKDISKDNSYLQELEKTLFKSISNSIANIDENVLYSLASSISKGNKDIFFVGEGFSYYSALDQARKYNKSGIRAFAINSTDYQLASIRDSDIVIFISASGITPSIKESVKYLEKKKVYSTLITLNHNVDKGFTNIIHGFIYDPNSFNEREFPKHSRIILLTILDYLYTKVIKLKTNKK